MAAYSTQDSTSSVLCFRVKRTAKRETRGQSLKGSAASCTYNCIPCCLLTLGSSYEGRSIKSLVFQVQYLDYSSTCYPIPHSRSWVRSPLINRSNSPKTICPIIQTAMPTPPLQVHHLLIPLFRYWIIRARNR